MTAPRSAELVARNDAMFREANEQISERAGELGVTPRIPFLCECADPECTSVVLLSPEEYQRVRERPNRFLNLPGHERAAGPWGKVVERRDGYVVEEKLGRA